jgi:hypothetical protein
VGCFDGSPPCGFPAYPVGYPAPGYPPIYITLTLMYSVSSSDRPREVASAPQCSVGAPCPCLVAGEHSLRLAYYLEEDRLSNEWLRAPIRAARPDWSDDLCAHVTFEGAYAHMFGPPNDEAFAGHPLAARGLAPYAVFEVDDSSWLRQLVEINSVHPYHKSEHFAAFKHFVFSFHDTTFECIAKGYSIALGRGTPLSVLEDFANEG